ncbi:MAG: hypothetical protein Q8R83_01420 [Legionellaceae bacterium]|nr:hypothetical protein [Legionellaceae bacterium]
MKTQQKKNANNQEKTYPEKFKEPKKNDKDADSDSQGRPNNPFF